MIDNNTRRYPRSLNEAFGPYTSSNIQPMQDPLEKRNWGIWTVIVVTILACTLIFFGDLNLITYLVKNGLIVLFLLGLFGGLGHLFLAAIDWIKDGDEIF